MNNLPLISIIIPTYNRAHYIGETLDSVLKQTHTNWECLVIDDGSTDNTTVIMANYCAQDTRIQYHQRPDTYLSGGNGARNFGFQISKGDYIQWFDSDDVMLPNLLQQQLENLTTNNKGMSICLLNRYNEDFSEVIKTNKKHVIKYSIYCDFVLRNFKAHLPTTFFKREIAKQYKFNEHLKKSQEVEFLQRIFREHESRIYLENKVLVGIRRHTGSITTKYNVETFKSILDVKLILIKEFPGNESNEVFNKLKSSYLDKLKIAFKYKNTSMFMSYLFKFKYLKLYDYFYFVMLYFVNFLFNKGEIYYNKKLKNMYA